MKGKREGKVVVGREKKAAWQGGSGRERRKILHLNYFYLSSERQLPQTCKYKTFLLDTNQLTLTSLSQPADTMMGFVLVGENLTQETQSE